ncbi:protoporphyrinogen/coproporphyrinogen oxidase [Geoalkalibacter sp.]|uniref:protoporphyrinogen/coproporphyrinogen oxidase n=1 Tax=Geoalkalibacter sp. TaxID=3041440 RepID=UPI00272E8C8F|nr:NAD(P)/FAD-dependent oxidoreductase [Geoalkalibacter sp.]
MSKKSVVVIGAGMAGLSAAHRLRESGCEVHVLEATSRIGGRASTDFVEDSLIDRGAQFLSDGYENVCRLLDEIKLRDSFRPCSPWTAVIKDGKGRAVSSSRPWSVNTSGLLNLADSMALATGSRQLMKETGALPLDDFSRWREFDDQTAAAWIERQFNRQILEYVFEPMLQSFFFQEPEDMSRALAMLVWNFGGRDKQPRALRGGMEDLPHALAENLRISLRSPVLGIAENSSQVRVITAEHELIADFAVLAVPAPQARTLRASDDEVENRLLETPYSPALVLALFVPDGLPKTAMPSDVHGIMVPRRERRVIGGITVVTRKCAIYVDRGELLQVVIGGEAARRLLDAPQEDILGEVVPEIDSYFPGISPRIDTVKIYRWPEAAACTPVGRCRDIHRYRNHEGPRKVYLAGDYMGARNVEGAVESALWAARAIAAQAIARG